MKNSTPHQPHPQHLEVELKLGLPTTDPLALERLLQAATPLIDLTAKHEHLDNIYFDTPDQILRQAKAALRIRRVGSENNLQWLQTLKMGGLAGLGDGALTQRGEWENTVPGPELDFELLRATPWAQLDPDGQVLRALQPCFATLFDRTTWVVQVDGDTSVEVALDIGHVVVGDYGAPICELELELKSGPPSALLELAQRLSQFVGVIPLSMSKAERGYAFAQRTLHAPRSARSPAIEHRMPAHAIAQSVLRESFDHFTANLNSLRSADGAEVVHQARVGLRRLKSAMRLFKKWVPATSTSAMEALEPLVKSLGQLRDLEVAMTQTLPPLANAYTSGNRQRQDHWRTLAHTLNTEAHQQRQCVREILDTPATGTALITLAQWIESPPYEAEKGQDETKEPRHAWALARIQEMHTALKKALQATNTPANQHRARILAKRVRYGIEAIQPLLPRKKADKWLQQAKSIQAGIGAQRDLQQALEMAGRLQLAAGIADFLRGYIAAQAPNTDVSKPLST
jgi:inorganic triphosphatase YgiF